LSTHGRAEQILRELGLTHSQAKVYIALSRLGKSRTAKEASNSSHVARQDVYRIIAELQQIGLVEKVIANPTRFKPTPIREALSLLLEKRRSEIASLQEEAFELATAFPEKDHEAIFEEDKDQLVLVSDKIAFARPARKVAEAANRSIFMITSWREYVQLLSMQSEAWNNAVENGVYIRWLTEKSTNGGSIQGPATVIRNPHFSLRVLPDIPVARLGGYDDVGAFISVSSNPNGAETTALWTSSRTIVSLVTEYFEMKWKQGSEIQP
jgi:sugar-specific transcriptional regulator TrmB